MEEEQEAIDHKEQEAKNALVDDSEKVSIEISSSF
jgi:hypothetical protein